MPLDGLSTEIGECWICYDTQREGDIIQPCDCKGGMRVVHHDCLKTWLLEVCFHAIYSWCNCFCKTVVVFFENNHFATTKSCLDVFHFVTLQLSDIGIYKSNNYDLLIDI